MDTKEAYLKKFRAKLAEHNAQIDKLGARLAEMHADAAIEANGLLARLKSQRDAASRKLEEINAAGEHAWKDLQVGAEIIWEDLREISDSVRNRFR